MIKDQIVPGTKGYELVIDSFKQASLELDFKVVNRHFIEYLPDQPALVLDAGSGVGQNAAALSKMGYEVVAVEPFQPFLDVAEETFKGLHIQWIKDSLPDLAKLQNIKNGFDFILMDGVWHHLDSSERALCIERFSGLLKSGGRCAISLRNGPAGAGKHVFPSCTQELERLASSSGFSVRFHINNLPSVMKHKPDVSWAKVIIQKI